MYLKSRCKAKNRWTAMQMEKTGPMSSIVCAMRIAMRHHQSCEPRYAHHHVTESADALYWPLHSARDVMCARTLIRMHAHVHIYERLDTDVYIRIPAARDRNDLQTSEPPASKPTSQPTSQPASTPPIHQSTSPPIHQPTRPKGFGSLGASEASEA